MTARIIDLDAAMAARRAAKDKPASAAPIQLTDAERAAVASCFSALSGAGLSNMVLGAAGLFCMAWIISQRPPLKPEPRS